jgi:hypothetical protein
LFPVTEQTQPEPVAATVVKALGIASVTVTVPEVRPGPVFETTTLHDSVCPTTIGSTASVLVTPRLVQVTVVDDVALPALGPPPLTLAEVLLVPQVAAVPVIVIGGKLAEGARESPREQLILDGPVTEQVHPVPEALTGEKPVKVAVAVTVPSVAAEARVFVAVSVQLSVEPTLIGSMASTNETPHDGAACADATRAGFRPCEIKAAVSTSTLRTATVLRFTRGRISSVLLTLAADTGTTERRRPPARGGMVRRATCYRTGSPRGTTPE